MFLFVDDIDDDNSGINGIYVFFSNILFVVLITLSVELITIYDSEYTSQPEPSQPNNILTISLTILNLNNTINYKLPTKTIT